jgi:L-alanine-DL-glutamate epimerase-like enolase superfamily enzyme
LTSTSLEEEAKLRDEITFQDLTAVEGWVKIPQEPGLGVKLNPEAITSYRRESR